MSLLNLPFYNLEDNEFFEEVVHINNLENTYSLEQLERKRFNIFEFHNNRYNYDNDPDNFLLNNLDLNRLRARYVYPDEIKEAVNFNALDELKVFFHNICSLPRHFDDFSYLVKNDLSSGFDVLALCETKLINDIECLYNIDSYSLFTVNRTRNSGGLAIYVKNILPIG